MSEMEITVPIEGSEYNELIVIEKYGDRYSLVLGGKSKQGNVYKKWCFPQDMDKNPREKAIPWKIPLGSGTDAKKTVEGIAKAFGIIPGIKETTGYQQPSGYANPETDDDIPF